MIHAKMTTFSSSFILRLMRKGSILPVMSSNPSTRNHQHPNNIGSVKDRITIIIVDQIRTDQNHHRPWIQPPRQFKIDVKAGFVLPENPTTVVNFLHFRIQYYRPVNFRIKTKIIHVNIYRILSSTGEKQLIFC